MTRTRLVAITAKGALIFSLFQNGGYAQDTTTTATATASNTASGGIISGHHVAGVVAGVGAPVQVPDLEEPKIGDDDHDNDINDNKSNYKDKEELYQDCRRHPHWAGELWEKCPEFTGWKPIRRDWWENHAFAEMDNYTDPMNDCIETEFLEFMETWPDCSLEENEYDPYCYVPPETHVTSVFRHQEEGELATVELALTPQEGFAVQAVARCIRKVFPNEEPYFEKRAFGLENSEETNNYLESGNVCTFLTGFLQIFVPGVAAQVVHVATVAWQEMGWEDEGYPDPRTLGIRTTEHLSYETTSKLGVHSDEGSNYTVLIALSDPEDYEGGEYRLETDYVKYKPASLTALIFMSETPHGVNPVLTGKRETFATELWDFYDVQLSISRPDISVAKDFDEEYSEELRKMMEEGDFDEDDEDEDDEDGVDDHPSEEEEEGSFKITGEEL